MNSQPNRSVFPSLSLRGWRGLLVKGVSTSLLVSFLLNFPLLLSLLFDVGQHSDKPNPMLNYTEYFTGLGFNFSLGLLLFMLHSLLLERNIHAALRHLMVWPVAIGSIYASVRFHLSLIDAPQHVLHGLGGIYGGQASLVSVITILSANLFYLSDRQREHRIEIERLAAENIRSQYNMLKSQIDPHFMFNTLNALNALIAIDPAKAQDYLVEMTTLLRHSLSQRETILLREELDVARSYAYLMNIRYGDALTFDFRIDDRYLDVPVVPYCLQIALENAVKHNSITKAFPLTVHIETEGGLLVVSNLIYKKKEETAGEGIGLSNLSERFRLMTGQGIEVRITDNVFTVNMPLIPSP